ARPWSGGSPTASAPAGRWSPARSVAFRRWRSARRTCAEAGSRALVERSKSNLNRAAAAAAEGHDLARGSKHPLALRRAFPRGGDLLAVHGADAVAVLEASLLRRRMGHDVDDLQPVIGSLALNSDHRRVGWLCGVL